MENMWYDDYGAIAKTIQMFGANQIILHSRCRDTIKEIHGWNIVKDRPEGIGRGGNPPGYCMALCNIVALCQKEFLQVEKKEPEEYRTRKKEPESNMQTRLTAWMRK